MFERPSYHFGSASSAILVALGGMVAGFAVTGVACGGFSASSHREQPAQSSITSGRSAQVRFASWPQRAVKGGQLQAFIETEARRLQQPDLVNGTAFRPSIVATATRTPHLDSQAVMRLADACAPTTPASALTSIAQVESGFAPLLIGVNGTGRNVVAPSTKAEAVEIAYDLIARGRNIDLGLAQINSRNLAGLGLSVEGAFDPCSNLAAAARVLDRSYVLALRTGGSSQPILQMAYSVYNTGRVDRGLENGYVGKIEQVQRLAIAR